MKFLAIVQAASNCTVIMLRADSLSCAVCHYPQESYAGVWCKLHTQHWWRAVQSGIVGNKWWKENLCMSRDTFTLILFVASFDRL